MHNLLCRSETFPITELFSEKARPCCAPAYNRFDNIRIQQDITIDLPELFVESILTNTSMRDASIAPQRRYFKVLRSLIYENSDIYADRSRFLSEMHIHGLKS